MLSAVCSAVLTWYPAGRAPVPRREGGACGCCQALSGAVGRCPGDRVCPGGGRRGRLCPRIVHAHAQVAERQTRWLQVPVSARTWGFKSPLAHSVECSIVNAQGDPHGSPCLRWEPRPVIRTRDDRLLPPRSRGPNSLSRPPSRKGSGSDARGSPSRACPFRPSGSPSRQTRLQQSARWFAQVSAVPR